MTITAGGWVFLIAAWGCILALSVYCTIKVLTSKQDKHE